MINKAKNFIKKETVLTISFLLAVISAFFVRPSLNYLGYIDFRVLAILFCLMTIVAGFRSIGVFDWMGHQLLAHTKSNRAIYLVFVGLCFFSSMLITNDVALLTFVPFTILVLTMNAQQSELIWLITLETIAANLGSMLTPLGNPQNLYLYTISGMSFADFIRTMLPYTAASLLLLCLLIFVHRTKKKEEPSTSQTMGCSSISNKHLLIDYSVLFVLCLLVVFHVMNYWLVLVIVLLVTALRSRTLLSQVDYSLLATFVCFFVFIGNMKNIPAVSHMLSGILLGHETITGVVASQAISNVPAAILLSGFTTDYEALLIGVNIGGLGTLIASLASLISYRFYVRTNDSHKGKYLGIFTIYNLLFLAVLLGLHLLLVMIH